MTTIKATDKKRRRLRRWGRIAGATLGAVVLLFFAAYAALAWYLHRNRDALLTRINDAASEHIGGTLHIGSMEPSLWGDFPYTSVVLRSVYLRDSLWSQHHHDLFKADEVFIRINPLRLFSKRIDIRKLTLRGGSVFLFTDSTGYSNRYLLARKPQPTEEKQDRKINFRSFALRDVRVEMEDAPKNKSFSFLVRRMEGLSGKSDNGWETSLDADVLVDRMYFNKTRGSFLRHAPLKGRVFLTYNAREKDLAVRSPRLLISGQPVQLLGRFSFLDRPAVFNLHLETKQVAYKQAVTWVSENIASKLRPFDFERPVDLYADLNGHIKFRDTPLVVVRWDVRNNVLHTPDADFKDISFGGYFTNEVVKGYGHGDPNSRLVFGPVRGNFEGIPFTADTIMATNLRYPLLRLHLRSDFDLEKVNDAGDLPLVFTDGKAALDLQYEGGISRDDTLYPKVDGTIKLSDAAFVYQPRSLSFSGVNGVLQLKGDDLYLKDVRATTPGGQLNVEGTALHFFRFFFSDPGKVNMFWRVSSPGLNLDPFSGLAGRRLQHKASARRKSSAGVLRFFTGLDNLLSRCSATLELAFHRLQYHHFVATNVKADAVFSHSDVQFPKIDLETAGGTMAVSGHIGQALAVNPFSLKADFRKVEVDRLFHGFDNFGQDALLAPNLDGRLSAQINVSGKMTEGGRVVKRTLGGRVKFVLEEGGLRNFEPFKKIGRIAFKKRNLDNVRFERIENVIDFNAGRFTIYPLAIRSTAFNLQVQGTYAPPSGTDLAIVLPLGNPKNEDPEQKRTRQVARGLTLYLRARDGKDGKVDIDWDPLKKGKKKTDSLFGVEPGQK